MSTTVEGLSPRTRRNRDDLAAAVKLKRPISAHAEEPIQVSQPGEDLAAYLRTHGGTAPLLLSTSRQRGLSPHTRRNPSLPPLRPARPRPISAHTEEPTHRSPCYRRSWAYLRTHGGTAGGSTAGAGSGGLSPHTRRNRPVAYRGSLFLRPISAHTEEPAVWKPAFDLMAAYLRTHGGTRAPVASCVTTTGLSPHTRRNPSQNHGSTRRAGPISAHTEEPSAMGRVNDLQRAYLRTHGGTSPS